MSKIYAGWLYIDLDEYDFLRELGVFGPMLYEDFSPISSIINLVKPLIKGSKQGTVRQCYCTKEVLTKLQEHYQKWWEDNYIHYDDGSTRNYPINQFSEVSQEWLNGRRGSEYEPKI